MLGLFFEPIILISRSNKLSPGSFARLPNPPESPADLRQRAIRMGAMLMNLPLSDRRVPEFSPARENGPEVAR